MRRTVLYIAMSLDEAETRPQASVMRRLSGEVDWLYCSGEGEGSYGEFSRTVGTVIMGRTTYDQITTVLSPGDWPYCGMSCYVVTNRPAAPAEGVTFTSEPPSALVRRLREGSGRDIWICGGASVANALMRADLIDVYRISVIPTLLGGGIRLFGPLDRELRLDFVSSSESGGITELCYTRRTSV